MLTSNGAYVNATIEHIFGVTGAGSQMEWRELSNRSGVLTHPAILAIHGNGVYASPVRRGVFILSELLCDQPSPPAERLSGRTVSHRLGRVEREVSRHRAEVLAG
jgi:hypothetical protein